MLSLSRARVQSLVRELRSHKPHGQKKRKKIPWRWWEVYIHFASFLGSIVGYKWLFLFTCLATYSTKLVAMLKHLTCLLLSFCMEYAPQTKALCHSVLTAKCNVFFIKFTFLRSLLCSITSYSWVLEDAYPWRCIVYHLFLLSCFYTYLSLERSSFAELRHTDWMAIWCLFLRLGWRWTTLRGA